MQLNKKLFSTAIMALLLLSVVAVAAPANAITSANANPDHGAVGTKVTVTGTGASPYSPVEAHWSTLSGALLNTTDADASGNFEFQVTIPSATNGAHAIVLTDGSTTNVGATFTVEPSLKASAERVLPGDSLTLTGHGFDGESDIEVTFDSTTLATPVSVTLSTPSITTNATGSFSAVVTVPTTIAAPADFDTYTVTAEDEATNTADDSVVIDYYVTCTPDQGPSGITVTIAGRIPANKAFTATFGGVVAFTGTSSSTGDYSGTYALTGPIAGTSYAVVVQWDVTEDVDTTFTGSNAPTLPTYTTPVSDVAGTVVTIDGEGFSAKANIELYIGNTLVNSTSMNDDFGPTDSDGKFAGLDFTIPDLAPGTYSLVVTDEFGATTGSQYSIEILAAPYTTIALRSGSYVQGDILSFIIQSTDPAFASVSLTIRAPGALFWANVPLTLTTVGSTDYVLYPNQVDSAYNHFVLPADAPTGTWNWTISFTDTKGVHDSSADNWATGTFTVGVGGTGGIVDAINGLNGTLVNIQDNVATILTDVGVVKGIVTSIEDGIASISIPDLGTITTTLSSIDAVLGDVAGRVVTIDTTVGSFDTTLEAINAQVTSLSGSVATVQTDLGSLQGTVTSISGNVATIQTDIGSLQVDISGLQGEVSDTQSNVSGIPTLVYIAIVLALVAAIAAIASIVLMRQKIAG